MQETPEQYTERLLSYLQGTTSMKVLVATPRKLTRLTKGATRARLLKRPMPGKWSVAEILAHLVDTELAYSVRLRLMLEAPGVPIQAFDQNVWESYSQYRKEDPKESLEAFRLIRERNVRLLHNIPAAMWENYGMHSERGKESITRLTDLTAGHDINHLQQVERILRPGSRKNG